MGKRVNTRIGSFYLSLYMKTKNKFIVILLFEVLLFSSCGKEQQKFSVKTFETQCGWGYSIFENDKLIIRQQYIPSIREQKSFKSEQEALKIGDFVIEKLKQHKSPSLTSAEVKNNISL